MNCTFWTRLNILIIIISEREVSLAYIKVDWSRPHTHIQRERERERERDCILKFPFYIAPLHGGGVSLFFCVVVEI